jgi:3-oxoacyl-[acyl-carrier protein] reductase
VSEGRVIIVTGGGSGIGRGVAARFATHGDQIVIIGRTEKKLKAAAGELGCAWRRADVSQRAQVTGAIDSIVAEYGRVDVLVNCAGFVRGNSTTDPLEEAERTWDAEMGANLKGSYLMALACAPHLTRPGGRIITISSIAAYTGGSRGGAIGYSAAKAGTHGLTFGLARELSPQGITVNAIAPGLITETDFFGGPLPPERIEAVVAQVPVGRAGRPADIAETAFFLASQGAAYITGEIVNINGGWLFGR